MTARNGSGLASAQSQAVGPVRPSTAQIKTSLLSQVAPYGRPARIAMLLRGGGYRYDCAALSAGTMEISWYQVPKGAHVTSVRKAPKPVLIAYGRVTFRTAGSAHMTVKLTNSGRQLLKRSKQVRLTAKGTFAAVGVGAVNATTTFALRR